jgi:hypothetical protein
MEQCVRSGQKRRKSGLKSPSRSASLDETWLHVAIYIGAHLRGIATTRMPRCADRERRVPCAIHRVDCHAVGQAWEPLSAPGVRRGIQRAQSIAMASALNSSLCRRRRRRPGPLSESIVSTCPPRVELTPESWTVGGYFAARRRRYSMGLSPSNFRRIRSWL